VTGVQTCALPIYIFFENGSYVRFNRSENLIEGLEALKAASEGKIDKALDFFKNKEFGSGTKGFWDAIDTEDPNQFSNLRIQFVYNTRPDEVDELIEDVEQISAQNEADIQRNLAEEIETASNIMRGESYVERREEEQFQRNLANERYHENHYQYYLNNRRNLEASFFPSQSELRTIRNSKNGSRNNS
jgi:hypothetical protein